MALPSDLKIDPSEPDKSNEYIFVTISPLKVGTPYKFQFQWIFEDPKLNELVKDKWSNVYDYISKSAAKPSAVTNLTAKWTDASSTEVNTLFVKFTHDNTLNNGTNNNTAVDKYLIRVVYAAGTANEIKYEEYWTDFVKTNSTKIWTMSKLENKQRFGGFFRNQFTVTVIPIDSINRTEGDPVTVLSDVATNPLSPPVISVTAGNFEYFVSWNDQDRSILEAIYIEEVVSDSLTAPTSGWAFKKKSLENPVIISGVADQKRWVRAYFITTEGQQTGYSNAVSVTPIDPVKQGSDLTPPNNVVSVSAAWNGNTLELTPTFPAVDESMRYIIELTANSQTRTFLRWKNQLVSGKLSITQDELYSNFGAHYNSFTGLFKTVDKADNANTGTAFTVAAKANPLLGVVPTFTLTAITNGYTATWTQPTSAAYAKVYESGTSWGAGNPLETDLVFSGQSPAIIKKTVYTLRYVKIKYLTVDGFESSWSAEQTVTPIDSIGVDTNPPAAPSAGLTATSGIDASGTLGFNGFVNLSWTAVSDTTLRGYRIRFRPAAKTASITAASWASNLITYTANNTFLAGQTVTVTGSSNTAYNITGTVSSPTATTFQLSLVTNPGVFSGTATASTATANYSYLDSPGTGTSYRLNGLATGATYEIAIASYDEFNNTSSSYSTFTNQTISGTPAIANYITAGPGFQFGSGIKNSSGSQDSTIQGIYLSTSNYWYINSSNSASFKVGGASTNYVSWNGSTLTTDGNITARGGSFSGNIELKSAGASIWNGPLNSGGTLGGDGFILNNSGLSIRKGSINLRLDTTDGGIYAQYGQIAGWTIDSAKIERLTASQYSGISSSGTYAFYAGASASGNSGGDTSAPFWVKPDGSVRANNISITGGSLTIGTNFSVLATGAMTASSANITGAITATSGKITGNFQIESPGTLYIGGLLTDTGVNRILLNSSGIAAYPSGTSTAAFSLLTDGTATLKKGTIAGWQIFDTYIQKGGIKLDSASTYIAADTTISSLAYSAGVAAPAASSDVVIWAGQTNYTNRTGAPFRVTADGAVTATNANLVGKLTVTSGGTMSFGKDAGGTGNNGMYLGATTDYIYDNGNFKLGAGRLTFTYNSTTPSLSVLEIKNTKLFLNLTSNEDGTFGDSTVVQDEGNQQLTIGRAFFYGGTANPNTNSITARSQVNGGAQGTSAFNVGDIWIQRV